MCLSLYLWGFQFYIWLTIACYFHCCRNRLEKNDQTRFDQSSGAYSGWRGQASINPFINRSADLWADFTDAERWVAGHVADALVPTLETLMDAVVPFSGAIAHFADLDQPLEKGISNLKNKMKMLMRMFIKIKN